MKFRKWMLLGTAGLTLLGTPLLQSCKDSDGIEVIDEKLEIERIREVMFKKGQEIFDIVSKSVHLTGGEEGMFEYNLTGGDGLKVEASVHEGKVTYLNIGKVVEGDVPPGYWHPSGLYIGDFVFRVSANDDANGLLVVYGDDFKGFGDNEHYVYISFPTPGNPFQPEKEATDLSDFQKGLKRIQELKNMVEKTFVPTKGSMIQGTPL